MFIFIEIITFIAVIYSQSCQMFFVEKDIYAIQNEQIEWTLSKLMIGSSLRYQIDEENESYFTLSPLFEKNKVFYFPQSLNNKTPTKVFKTRFDKLWLDSFIFIDNSLDGSYLYLSEDNNLQDYQIIMKVFQNGNCVNLDFITEHIYIIACIKSQETKINLYLIDKANNILDQYLVEEDFQLNKVKLEVQQIDINQYVYLYQQKDRIYVFEIFGNQIINCNCDLYKNKIELLLGYPINDLVIIDIQIAEQSLFLLDQQYGIIQCKLLNNQWISASQISFKYAFSEYVMMSINSISHLNNNYGLYNIFITVSQNQYYMYEQYQSSSTLISYMNINSFDIDKSFLYFNSYTIILISNDQVYFHQPSEIIQLDEVPIDVIGDPLSDNIQIYYKDRVEIRTIDRKVTFQAQSKLILEPQTANLTGYYQDTMICRSTFKYQVFHKNDGKLYEKLSTYKYNSLVFYPNYPQTKLSQIELPQGPNIQAKFKLEGQDTNKIIQSQYFNTVILTDQLGIINLSNYIFVQLIQTYLSQQLLLLVQQSNWHTYLMKCKKAFLSISMYECRTQAVLDFRYYLSSSNVKTYAFSGRVIMSLVNQNKHSLQLYELSDQFQLLTQINTKLTDENALITDFVVLSDKIIILLNLKELIQIYSYEGVLLNEINLQTDPEWQPQHLYLNPQQQSRLLFVKCLNQIYIFYLNVDYQLLKKIKVQNNLEVEMEIVIIYNQFFIFYKSINQQGMIAYSLFNLLDIHYLVEIPLYMYILQSPLQVVYHYTDNFIFIRVYDPISQNTNLLVMYPQNWLQARHYIETNINLYTYVLDKYPINLSVGNSQNTIIYAQINSVFFLLEVYTNIEATVQVSEDMQDGYIRDSLITSSYFNPFYPLETNLKSTSRFVNLYTNILFNSLVFNNSNLTIGVEPQLYSIPIDTWFQGQIFQYEIECLQCGTLENSLVFMQNKLQQERTFQFDNYNIIDVEQLREYLVILTDQNIILTSINAEIIIYIQPLVEYFSPSYLKVSEEQNLIMVIGHADIVFYRLSNFIIFYINRIFPNKVFLITSLVIVDNFLILINQNSQIQFYQIIIEKENITLDSCSLNLYSAFFKVQYLDMTSIQALKYTDSTDLYICDTYYGVVWLTFQILSNNIVILDQGVYDVKDLLKQLDIATSAVPLFYNLLKVDEIEDLFILLTDDSGGYIIRIIQPQVTILQIIQNYSVFNKLKYSKYFQGYLCITYQDYQQNIVYTFNHIKKYLTTTSDLKTAKPILIEGGMSTQINNYQFSPVFLFTYFNERVNFFAIYQNGQSLTLFKIEDSVSIQIFNGQEYKSQQPITLKALNSLTSTQIEFRLNQSDSNGVKNINMIIWIIVVLVIIVFVAIVIILIFWVKKKYKKRKSIGKEVVLIN